MKAYHVYILKCADSTFYTGVTSNLEQRVAQHKAGTFSGSYTSRRRDVELVFAEQFTHINDAIAAEKRVKKWSQEKKQKLISGEWSI